MGGRGKTNVVRRLAGTGPILEMRTCGNSIPVLYICNGIEKS